MIIEKKDRTVKNKLYQRLKRVHRGMLDRCYNPNNGGYYNYGAKGARVCGEWQTFEGFLATIDTVEGWDEDRYVTERLSLDKDKVWGNKLYSPETCRFTTVSQNNTIKPNQQYQIVGYSPDEVLYRFHSANGFATQHNLDCNTILNVAKGVYKQHRGWQFCMSADYYDGIFVKPYSWEHQLIGLSPDGVEHVFSNASEFARDHGLLEATVIYACAKGKNQHSRLWQFRHLDELETFPFLDPKDLVPASRRDQLMEATDPEGNLYTFYNKTAFAKEHNLDRGMMLKVIQGKFEHHRGWTFRNL